MRPLYLGIDIGGWKIRGLVWDGRRVVAGREFRTPQRRRQFEEQLGRIARTLNRLAGNRVAGIGIGVAGVISGTRVLASPNIPYLKRFDFKALFPRRRLRVDNDARAFARAAWRDPVLARARRILAFTIGTGIGRAYGRGGRIIRLKQFEHPERGEPSYQRIRDRASDAILADFLGSRLTRIAKRFPADAIVIGGGVLGRRDFFRRLQAAFRRHGLRTPLRRIRRERNAGAIGAALLVQKRAE